MEKYVEALKGISYKDWELLKRFVDGMFNHRANDFKTSLEFNGPVCTKEKLRDHMVVNPENFASLVCEATHGNDVEVQ